MGFIFQIIRLQKLMQLQPGQFPHVPAEQFEAWRRLELRSAFLFFFAMLSLALGMGIGVFALQFEHSVPVDAPASQQNLSPIIPLAMGGGTLLFFIGLVVSAIYGSQAAKMCKKLQITL